VNPAYHLLEFEEATIFSVCAGCTALARPAAPLWLEPECAAGCMLFWLGRSPRFFDRRRAWLGCDVVAELCERSLDMDLPLDLIRH
jgi:hypothetical protein